jgi:hypothetical protein
LARIQDSTAAVTGNAFITATGGTITTCGDYKIHTFTSDDTFTISAAPTPANAVVDYLVVAGGGAGGLTRGGGGAAGGYRESHCATTSGCYTASPLATPPCGAITAAIQTYPITVGGGGAGRPSASAGLGTDGTNSIFSTITSTGGGAGGGATSGVHIWKFRRFWRWSWWNIIRRFWWSRKYTTCKSTSRTTRRWFRSK